jgi:hypothetical protein
LPFHLATKLFNSGQLYSTTVLEKIAFSYLLFPLGPILLFFMLDSVPYQHSLNTWKSEHRRSVEKQERLNFFKSLIELITVLFFVYLAFLEGEGYKWHWITYFGISATALSVIFFIYAFIVPDAQK